MECAYRFQLFRRNACIASCPVLKIMDLRLAGSQMCEHLDQNVLRIMLLFLPLLPHVRSRLKYEHHPEVTQVIPGHPECAAVQDLNLKDRWHLLYLGLARAQLLTFLSTDDKRLSLKAAFWCVLKTKLNTLKGRRGKNLHTVLCIFLWE